MPLLRTVLTGGLRAAVGLLETFGAKGARWEWKKRSWEQALEERLAHWENVGRGVSAPLRMCPACRMLVERSVSTCPSCGGSMRGVAGGGVGRALGLVVPRAPSLSAIILSVNVGMALLVTLLGTSGGRDAWGVLMNPGDLLRIGDKIAPAIHAGEYWRLISANYLHVGIIHLALNSLALVQLGPLVERSWGARRLFVIYTVTGVCGFALSAAVRPDYPSAGASAAIYGLLAFAFVFSRFRSGPGGRAVASQLGQSLLFMVAMFFIPRIDNTAHVGGALAGAALAFVFDPIEPRTPAAKAWLWLVSGVLLAATVYAFVMMGLYYAAFLEHFRTGG